MDRATTRQLMDFESFQYMQRIETALALRLGLSSLHSGIQIIRNEKGWRENEKNINYIWIANIARSFVGYGGLFAVQFNESKFRDQHNPAELVQGIFLSDNDTGISDIYIERASTFPDKISAHTGFTLFDAGSSFTLDGTHYIFKVIANNINAAILLSNPTSAGWQQWLIDIWSLGEYLANKAGNEEMVRLFA